MLKVILALIISIANADWVPGQLFVRDDHASVDGLDFYVNTPSKIGIPDSWQTLDLTPLGVPKTAKSVFFSGLMLITHGNAEGICDLWVSFRKPGTAFSPDWIGQAVTIKTTGGVRSGLSTFVPVKDGKVEYYWHRSTFGEYPGQCAYGINLQLQAYVE